MNNLNDQNLICCLKTRYNRDDIYTEAGSNILVALNPYRRIENLYTDDKLLEYAMEMRKVKKYYSALIK